MVTIVEHKPPEQVQIRQQVHVRWPVGDEWPTASEFQKLGTLVKSRYPGLAEGMDRGTEFKTAFLYLMFAGRRATPDPSRAMSWWTQCANDYFDRHGLVARTNSDALVGAAICHGIPFTGPAHATLGITLGESGEPLPSSWKKALADNCLPDPVAARPLDTSIGTAQRYSVLMVSTVSFLHGR
jgi:hypothetical protein